MSGIVISYTFRSAWKQILYWGLGLGVLGAYIVFIASDSDIVQGYANLFESMPPAMLQAFGASDVELLRTAEGWIVSIFVSEAGIFLSIFAVMAGLNITTNEEQSGLMDVILSLPISRAAYLDRAVDRLCLDWFWNHSCVRGTDAVKRSRAGRRCASG